MSGAGPTLPPLNLEGGETRRHHPFGRVANVLVLAGASLSIIQSVVVAMGAFLAPVQEGFELEGFALLVWLVLGMGIPIAVGWLALRALRSWWRRSVSVVGRVLTAGLVALPSTVLLTVPVDGELLTPIGYLPAGLLLTAAAFLSRGKVLAAKEAGRGGLSD